MGAVALPRRRRRLDVFEQRRFLGPALIAPAILFIAALVGAPLLLAIYLSFTNAHSGSLSGDFVGFANYANEWRNPVFRTALGNTALYTLVS